MDRPTALDAVPASPPATGPAAPPGQAHCASTTASHETVAWCRQREHALITYNPQSDMSFCRCGERRSPGEQPMDWKAKREVFHRCEPGSACSCYTS
ncbi:hypothetical protein ACFVH7_27165 [Kitasatospora indigofera]|uniref:hypothetical protein n=1 Tax=Kitasatospora indigofera TaxID=67307 RepID=UPI00362E49BD